MTIICGGQSLAYHSAIVCPRSSFFEAALWGNFEEGKSKTINLENEKFPMVRRMMRYCYLFDYDDQDETAMSDVEVNARMYAMADQFGVPGLKTAAAAKFARCCTWRQSVEVPVGLDILLDCVETVFTSTPDTDHTLRKSRASALVCLLQKHQDLVETSQFKDKCLLFPDFAYHMVKAGIYVGASLRYAGWRPSRDERDGILEGAWR